MTISQKHAQILFAIIMVGTMTFIITGANLFVNNGFTFHFFAWMRNWLFAYIIALPIMLILSSPLRKIIGKYTKK